MFALELELVICATCFDGTVFFHYDVQGLIFDSGVSILLAVCYSTGTVDLDTLLFNSTIVPALESP
jgi:hypothetical protein